MMPQATVLIDHMIWHMYGVELRLRTVSCECLKNQSPEPEGNTFDNPFTVVPHSVDLRGVRTDHPDTNYITCNMITLRGVGWSVRPITG
jgi:hypothetical protein